MNKAYETEWKGIKSIIFCASPGKAKNITKMCANDAGYNPKFIDISCKRKKDFDLKMDIRGNTPNPNQCYDVGYFQCLYPYTPDELAVMRIATDG